MFCMQSFESNERLINTLGAKQDTIISHVDGIETLLTENLTVDTGLSQPVTESQLTNHLPLPVNLNSFPDFFPISAFGEPEVVNPFPLVQVDFVYSINNKLGITETYGSGSASKDASNPHLVLQTGAAINSWARYRTRRYLKYRSGQGLVVRYSSMFTAGAEGSIQVSGAFHIENQSNVPTIIDGYGFGYNGTTFGILHANNGTLTWIPKTDFNCDKLDGNGVSGMNLDPTKFNLYQVKYPYLGVGTVFFYVEKPSGGMICVHKIEYPNEHTKAQLGNPNLVMQSLVYNSTNNTNIKLTEVTKAGFISGIRRPLGPKRVIDKIISLSGTTEQFMFSLRCNTTINSLTNRSQLHLKRVSGANTGNNAVVIRIYKNATTSGESFTNFDTVNSISAYSDVGSYTVGTGELVYVLNLASNTNDSDDVENFDDILEPGETWVITAQGRANGQVPQVSLIWIEDI